MRIIFILLFLAGSALAQESGVSETSLQEASPSENKFSFFYQYMIRDLSDTQSAQKLRNEKGNILPTSLRFDQHLLSLGYKVSPNLRLEAGTSFLKSKINLAGFVMIPAGPQMMKQDISIDSGSSGISDLRVGGTYTLLENGGHSLSFTEHLNLPTGSVNEQDQGRFLPYSGQLGSGTYDLHSTLAYQLGSGAGWRLGSDLSYILRTGRSDRNYRMGNQFIANLLAGYQFGRIGGLFVKGRLRDWQASKDPVYQSGAQVNDPYVEAGTRWEALAVARLGLPLPGYIGALLLEGGLPFYQGQSGGEVQLESDWYLQTGIAVSL